MNARAFLLCVVALLAAYSCSVPPPRTSTSAHPANDFQAATPQARDFEAAIARIERDDPESPAALSAQLEYADFLLSESTGPCAERLARARELLGSVDASRKANVMFPDGWARVADLEYRLYLARSACGSEANRASELRSAVAAARRAVELYRNVFDYHSMVVMQFDAGIALHELGETAAAIAALEAAIEMDREYGFRDDAAENYKLLLSFRGRPADAAQVAELMQDFPERQRMLSFAWHPSDAQIAIEDHRECLNDDQIVASRAAAAFERRIAANAEGGWIVSYADRLNRYEPGVWPTIEGAQTPPMVFPPAPLPAVGFKVSGTGEFQGVTDLESFASRLAAKTEVLIQAAEPSGGRARRLMSDAVQNAAANLSPGRLEAATAESYQLETAMWIGATLDQGVWYEISAPLSLPGIPTLVLQNRIQFAFTRMLPCTAAEAQHRCVELVFRAAPDPVSVGNAMADLGVPRRQFSYAASIEGRIVTDPATLMPYAREERIYSYVSLGRNKNVKVLQSEHLVSTATYTAQPKRSTSERKR
jgi:tetratricopeptide (TPR) repeat protein